MKDREQDRGGHFSFAFVSGLVVGGILMFVLGTKKGRKLLEEILSDGEIFWGEILEKNPELEEKLEEKTVEVAGKIVGTKETVDSIIDKSDGLGSFAHKTAARFFHRKGRPLT